MFITASGISKKYYRPTKNASHFEAVKTMDFALEPGKLTEITGRSGSGKSTLLYMLAGLLKPTTGTVSFDGTDVYSLKDDELSRVRNAAIGVIPQGQTGLFALTVLQNVLAPAAIYGDTSALEARAKELLRQVGIADLADAKMSELSGGEMRRMAIARALMNHPDLVLADEPSGNLDEANSAMLNELIGELNEKFNQAFLIVTHDEKLASFAKRRVVMHGGVIQ